MDMKRKAIIILTMFLTASAIFAQKPMTLKDCIDYARRHSPSYQKAKNDYIATINTYKAFKASYLPQLELNGSAPGVERAINRITQPDGSANFVSQSQMFSSAGLSVSQLFAPTGATFSVSSRISRMDMFGEMETSYWLATPVQVSLNQPIFRYNSMKWDNKIQDMRNRNAQKRFNETMEDIAIDVASAFFDLYIAEMRVKNTSFNKAVNDTMYRVSQGRYKVGKIAENDLLQNELALINSEINLEQAYLDLQNARDNLRLTLGMPLKDTIVIEPQTVVPIGEITYELALEAAMENRSDILAYEIAKVQADMEVNRIKSDNNFNANLSASFGLNQTAGDLPDTYKDLLDQERVNITFSMPLFQWGKSKYEYEAALARQEITHNEMDYALKKFKQTLKYETAKYEQYKKQLEVAEKSMNVAERRFQVARNRYMVSKINMDSFYMAQNEKDNAFTGYIRALKSFWLAHYRMRRLTLYDFINSAPINYKL